MRQLLAAAGKPEGDRLVVASKGKRSRRRGDGRGGAQRGGATVKAHPTAAPLNWLTLGAVIAAVGCSSPLGPGERRALEVGRERWAERPFADYIFDTQRGCFCPPELVGPARVTVRQGAITTVTLLETGVAAPPGDWYTIEQLFERIPELAGGEGVADVAVSYDDRLGYPVSIEVRAEEDVVDGGSNYVVSNVGPAP